MKEDRAAQAALSFARRVPDGYERLRVRGAHLVAVRGGPAVRAAEMIEASGSLFAAAAETGTVWLQGRGPVPVVPGPDGPWVVRRYRRGGAFAAWLGDRYLRGGEPRPFRELAVSAGVRARGIRTPRVLAAAVYPSGLFYRGDLVTRLVPDAVDLAAVLAGSAAMSGVERERAWRAAGELVGGLATHGVAHPDLNLKNVLVRRTDAGPVAYLLDLDRCRLAAGPAGRGRAAMLRRFLRSVTKWEAKTGRVLRQEERLAFQAGYEQGGGSGSLSA